MIPREDIIVAIPSHDGKMYTRCIGSMMACAKYFEKNYFLVGNSDICSARNSIAHMFMEHSSYEWLMWIDCDIVYTEEDWELLWEDDDDLIVTASYARKILGWSPADYGMGFCRTHRSVFERLKELTNQDGADLLQRYYSHGEILINYFQNGVWGTNEYVGEDRGFFMFCRIAGIPVKGEKRTKLKHVGTFEYGYPHQIWDSGHPLGSENDRVYEEAKSNHSDGAN
jgi:glycosyltransferase involved in cell wall biosynthesis